MTVNEEQKYASILDGVFYENSWAFFINGLGSTWKTYLHRALLTNIRSKNLIALATASSGVRASILPGDRTAHSRLKIPINITNKLNCCISKQSTLAKLLQLTKLIIWDETAMVNKQAIEALNEILQDINNNNLLFGGKVIVFGGDFRQVIPVVPRAEKEKIINASLVT